MRALSLLVASLAAALVSAEQRTAQLFIEPVPSSSTASGKPRPLAEISYDPASLASSSVISYDPPELPDAAELVRIGLYDPKSRRWLSGTTLASVDNFSKGYSPNLLLTVDAKGEVLSAACRGVLIDAGQTRDFRPKAVVLVETRGKQPDLNKPVVLSPEGRKVAEEPEKTLFQKYVYPRCSRTTMRLHTDQEQVLVGPCYRCFPRTERWRRRQIDYNYNYYISSVQRSITTFTFNPRIDYEM
jgi:hypothetical protein